MADLEALQRRIDALLREAPDPGAAREDEPPSRTWKRRLARRKTPPARNPAAWSSRR